MRNRVFSNRTAWNLARNRLAIAAAEARRDGRPLLDLTNSNPTRAGLDYPSEAIAEALSGANSAHVYDPDPKGDPRARVAIAGWYDRQAGGGAPDPETIVLTPGTSEAYAWLFKLLCDPGERVLAPRPSYPLFEYLADLESVLIAPYALRYESRWGIDEESLERALAARAPRDENPPAEVPSPARAIVVVDPNNPTGSYFSGPERTMLGAFAKEHRLAVISDEVFRSYPLSQFGRTRGADAWPVAGDGGPLSLRLDGLSKSAGLPGLKVGWIVVDGPEPDRARALERLEVIADTYLPLASPIQRAIPRLIELGQVVAEQIRRRIRANDAFLRAALPPGSACEALRNEGGWSAVIRVPRRESEEDLTLHLLQEDGLLVQPGWLFDFENEAYVIVSLLTPEPLFAEGIRRLLDRAC